MIETVTAPPKPTAERRRLMLVTTCLTQCAGAEAQVIEIGRGMQQRGWDVEIVSMVPFFKSIPDLGHPSIRAASLNMRRGVADPTALVHLAAMVRRSRPDVVHSHLAQANLLVRTARLFCRIPVLVCTIHGYKMYSIKTGRFRMREIAHRFTDRMADATTVVCQAGADRYARVKAVSPERLMMVPNGIRTAPYQPSDAARESARRDAGLRDEFAWLAAGRLVKVKDYDTMLRAFALVLEAYPSQVLLIAGDGPERHALERTAGDLGIGGRVRFLGLRRDVPRLMAAADAFVLSSIFEGMPMVLLEAGASGLPLVATDVGGNREVVAPRGGILVPERNPLELGRAMQRIAGASERERLAMGRAARELVLRRHSMESILDRWEELYLRLMSRNTALAAKAAV